MSRFSSIIESLRAQRLELFKDSKKVRRSVAPRKKKHKEIKFDSPMLQSIFNELPEDLQKHIRRKVK